MARTKVNYDSQAKLFKVLMHPARLAILDVLGTNEACVCHLEAALGYRQAYFSSDMGAFFQVTNTVMLTIVVAYFYYILLSRIYSIIPYNRHN